MQTRRLPNICEEVAVLNNGKVFDEVEEHSMSGKKSRRAEGHGAMRLLVTLLMLAAVPTGKAQTPDTCPCSIWDSSATPTTVDGGDGAATEVGVRFRSDVPGYVTGIRFYKAATNTGTHPVSLWTNTGTLLSSATAAGESSSGWQEADFATPVAIVANTTYVAAYLAPNGHYSFDASTFAAIGVDNPPLHALVNGADGLNGVYQYTSTSAFPDQSFQSTNYWVDVVFIRTDAVGTPRVLAVTPARGSSGVGVSPVVTASFSKSMDASTLSGTTFILKDHSGNQVAATVSYDPSSNTAILTPSSKLDFSSNYSVTVKGGAGGVKDTDGNAMGADVSWSFTTGGGPVLVVASQANPFTRYYAEILQAEGLNEFTVSDISTVNGSTLADYAVVILGDMSLTSEQVTMFGDWVTGGGNLVAMHPDPQLAGLLGLTATGSNLSDGYLQVQTGFGPGVGIVGQTIQYHGPAEQYTLNGATAIATLYSDATTPTASPAVTVMKVGSGQAAAFTYDLARSIVYTRQGNPAWAEQERIGLPPVRTSDLFFGNAPSDVQPDWNNLAKVQIPIADEQQRLLVNLMERMAAASGPLPRFWYLPSGFKAAVVMTGDDHNQGGTPGRFDTYLADSTPNCSVADWQCVRSTAYIWNATPITDEQAASYVAQGFELAPHVDSDPTCSNWTYQELSDDYTALIGTFASTWPSVPTPQTHRMHCISWSDYDSQPLVELAHGMRLDTNYYYFPDAFAQGRTGMFTGSGMPMRFADRNGNTIDVYQATTQLPDENTWNWPADIDTLLDNAIGALGYYGVFTANMHTDFVASAGSDAIVGSAQARGVPIVSAVQMLQWLDGRNSSLFGSLTWSAGTLSFTITAGTGARNLQAMLPMSSSQNTLAQLLLNGGPIPYTQQVIKGVTYAVFPASAGSYQALYTDPPQFEVSLSSTSLAFASQKLNTSSAVQTITLSSTGTMPVTIGGIVRAGANPGDFSETNTCGTSVAAGGMCTIDVTFTPSAMGSRTATIAITDNTIDTPQIIVLSGTGGIPSVSLGSTTLAFGTQLVGTPTAAQAVTLSNSGTAVLNITGIAVGGTNSGDFSETNTCGTSVAPGATCAINITFTPSVTGARAATIEIADNADDSPQSIVLSGTGGVPSVAFGGTTLAFGNQMVGTPSAVQAVTLNNSGTAVLNITGITVGGTNSGDFSQTNTCGTSVAASGTCTINVTFTPSATGSRAATIQIVDNATDSPQSVVLSGTGTMPSVVLGSTTLAFGTQLVGSASAVQLVTLSNSGTAVLNITGITVGGANSGDFSETNTCGTTVAVGGTCAVNVTFTPSATGGRAAVIQIVDNASDSPQSVALSGTGTMPDGTLGSSALVFGTQLVGTAATAQSVTLTNSGTAVLNITGITVGGTNSGDFSETNTCGTSVAVGGMCAINVTFTPSATGSRTASISINDNASGSPHSTSLDGRGMDISLALTSGNSATQTVNAGQTATYNLQFAMAGGVAGDSISANVTCAGAPALASCSPSSSTATATPGSPAAFSIAVRTTGSASSSAGLGPNSRPPAGGLALLAALLPGVMMLIWPGMRGKGLRTRIRCAGLWLLLSAAMFLAGCGGGSMSPPVSSPSTPAGNYTLTVTATAGNRVQSTQLTLIVR
jgi:hypothetical protein